MAKSRKSSLNRDVGVAKTGMNKDAHPTSLNEKSYVHALNANYEGQDGDLINLQNEESNILCSKFKDGFLVIGYQKDITADRTYFFLTNPTTGESEIGFIPELETQLSFTDTLKKCGCSVEAVFADGLESIPQVETCTYTTLIADYTAACPGGLTGNKCLNFNINYPISSVLKDEKGNKILYFTDDLNPRRRLEIDFLDQYFVKTEFCSSDPTHPDYNANCDCGLVDVPTCINCNKLKILPEHEPLCINVEGTVVGGNLRHGQYAFFAGYSDVNGNMMTSYLTATNTVSINDPNKLVYEQPELDALTNFSLKIKIDGLDPAFDYYKVGVMEITSVDGAQSFFSVGVFPTSQKEVLYSGSSNRTQDRIDRAELTRIFPEYLKAKLVTATNNTLMFADLEARPDPNLQPVVNFMGQFAKWRAVMAEEDLYEKSFGTSNFRGYMRDEVVPFGIRFLTNDGYRTPVYPLIARTYTDDDRFFDATHEAGYNAAANSNIVIDAIRNANILDDALTVAPGAWTKDVYSVLKYGNEGCVEEARIFKWQYYNTASQDGGIITTCQTKQPTIITRTVERACSHTYETITNPIIPDNTSIKLTFPDGDVTPNFEDDATCVNGVARFTNFAAYVQDNQDVLSSIANDTSLSNSQRNLAALFVLDNYISTGPFALTRPCCGPSSIDDPGFPDTCGAETLISEEVEVISIAPTSEAPCVNVVYEDCSYYDRPSTSDFCFPFDLDPSSGDFKSQNSLNDIEVKGDGGSPGDNTLDALEFFVGKRRDKANNDVVFARQQPISGGTDPLACDSIPLDFTDYESAFSTYITPLFPDIIIEDKNGDTDEDAIAIDKTLNHQTTVQAPQLMYEFFQAGFGGSSSLDGGRIKNFRCVQKKDIDYNGRYLIGTDVGFAQTTNFGARGRVHKNARWYKVSVADRDKVYFSLSKASDPDGDKSKKDCLWYPDDVRVTFFETNTGEGRPFLNFDHCSGGSQDHNSAIISIDNKSKGIIELDIASARNAVSNPNGSAFTGSEIFIAVDTPLVRVKHGEKQKNSKFYSNGIKGGLGDPDHIAENGQHRYYYATPTYCFNVKANGQVIAHVEAFLKDTQLSIDKICRFSSECELETFTEVQCDPFLRTEGTFAYWESTVKYPNNNFLYDSRTKDDGTNLVITNNSIPSAIRGEFESVFTSATDPSTGTYTLNDNADFSCKPIRHFKFPDFAVSPTFGSDDKLYVQPVPFTKSKIFPIGFHIDNAVINAFLDIAVTNNFIDQDFRDSITHYEIFRGDTKLNRSIVAKGMMYDMYKAPEKDDRNVTVNKNVFFSNFPYNDLSDNKLLFEDSKRDNYIKHPFSNKSNNRFTFHSPDLSYERPILPFEMYVEADLVGDSRGAFAQVEDHPELTVLSDRAYRVARLLGGAQTTLEFLTNISSALIGTAQSMTITNYGVGVAWAGFGIYAGTALLNLVPDGRRNVSRWIQIFIGQGPRINHAYYYSSVGYLNGAHVPPPTGGLVPYAGDKTRGLKERLYIDSGRYRIDELFEDDPTIINNFNRESSVYLSTGNERNGSNPPLNSFNIGKDSYVKNYDDSRFSNSQSGCTKSSVSPEASASITSPYISLKRFVPNQYNELNDIFWLHTSYCGKLANDNSCDVVFGGDTFLSRFYHKRKFPFFTAPMIVGTQSLGNVPFAYSSVSNIGSPTYFLDYQFDQSDDVTVYGEVPFLKSGFQFDCETSKKLYMKLPSKFYLYYYGIPGFIVESRINNNFRYGENESNRFYYPGTTDYIGWTQENYVSIRERERFYYNETYSKENDLYNWSTLPANYDPKVWNTKFDHFDRVIFSLPDNNEQDLTDNFRVFLANNFYDFGNKYGPLYDIRNIEQQKVLARFDNGAVVFNAYNVISGSAEDLATAQDSRSLFGNTRPSDFFKTDLGYGGTQHRAMVSCQFGHYWTDAKRGRVYTVAPGGTKWDEISSYGMKNWFRENLPFRIKKQFPDMPDAMLDNAFDGIGISMTWDDRYLRVFLTKLDVRVKSSVLSNVSIEGLDFYYDDGKGKKIKIHPTDTAYFEPCAWTISYSPSLKSWVSFHSFTPNYYVNHQNYFSSGLNYGSVGTWNHLLGSNQTFQVYYGVLYPWTIEIPMKINYNTKMYEDLSYRLDVRRYTNNYDYHYYLENFDTLVLYNDRESTGLLNLITQEQNNLKQLIDLPRYKSDGVDILATHENYTWSINFFFDNVKEKHEQPIWTHACNNVDKTLNSGTFDYQPSFKNHIRGQYLLAQLSQKDESRLKFIFEHFIIDSHIYDAY